MSRPHDLQFEGPRPELVPAFVAPDHAFSLVAGRVVQKVNQTPHGAYKHPTPDRREGFRSRAPRTTSIA
jgi:hypothetical protein